MSFYTWRWNIASSPFRFPVKTMKSEFTQAHPFPHIADILSYLNTALFPEIKGGSHWYAVAQWGGDYQEKWDFTACDRSQLQVSDNYKSDHLWTRRQSLKQLLIAVQTLSLEVSMQEAVWN